LFIYLLIECISKTNITTKNRVCGGGFSIVEHFQMLNPSVMSSKYG